MPVVEYSELYLIKYTYMSSEGSTRSIYQSDVMNICYTIYRTKGERKYGIRNLWPLLHCTVPGTR